VRRLAIIALVALFLGCQQSPAPGPAPVGSLTVRLKAEGDALAARGDYEGAALRYQQAANQEPEDVSIRFALGSALSHLNRRGETVEQFGFVVTRGKPDSPEVQAARRWLIAAGETPPDVSFEPPPPQPQSAPVATASPPPALTAPPGKVRGRIEAGGLEGLDVIVALNGELNVEFGIGLRGKVGQPFEFDRVPPGRYRLAVEHGETSEILWDVPVTVASGKEVVVNLTGSNRQ
jgi:hypothetical protein